MIPKNPRLHGSHGQSSTSCPEFSTSGCATRANFHLLGYHYQKFGDICGNRTCSQNLRGRNHGEMDITKIGDQTHLPRSQCPGCHGSPSRSAIHRDRRVPSRRGYDLGLQRCFEANHRSMGGVYCCVCRCPRSLHWPQSSLNHSLSSGSLQKATLKILASMIARIQLSDVKSSDLSWIRSFSIGNVVEGEIQDVKEFGLVLGFKSHADVVGFVANHHLGGSTVGNGSVVKAFVLDISKLDGLVDMSLKPEFLGNSKIVGANNLPKKKKRQRVSSMELELLQNVNAVVEVLKENYMVLSIPDYNHAISYASVMDYSTQRLPNRRVCRP